MANFEITLAAAASVAPGVTHSGVKRRGAKKLPAVLQRYKWQKGCSSPQQRASTEKRLQPIRRAHRRAKPLRGGVRKLNAETHGLNKLREALRRLGGRSLDPSTSIGKALMTWRKELVADMGGSENVSTMQLIDVDR
jgi:hypothetical protein